MRDETTVHGMYHPKIISNLTPEEYKQKWGHHPPHAPLEVIPRKLAPSLWNRFWAKVSFWKQ